MSGIQSLNSMFLVENTFTHGEQHERSSRRSSNEDALSCLSNDKMQFWLPSLSAQGSQSVLVPGEHVFVPDDVTAVPLSRWQSDVICGTQPEDEYLEPHMVTQAAPRAEPPTKSLSAVVVSHCLPDAPNIGDGRIFHASSSTETISQPFSSPIEPHSMEFRYASTHPIPPNVFFS